MTDRRCLFGTEIPTDPFLNASGRLWVNLVEQIHTGGRQRIEYSLHLAELVLGPVHGLLVLVDLLGEGGVLEAEGVEVRLQLPDVLRTQLALCTRRLTDTGEDTGEWGTEGELEAERERERKNEGEETRVATRREALPLFELVNPLGQLVLVLLQVPQVVSVLVDTGLEK